MPKHVPAPPPPTPQEEFEASLRALDAAAEALSHAVAEVRELGRAAGVRESKLADRLGEHISGPLLPHALGGRLGGMTLDVCARRRFAARLREYSAGLNERNATNAAHHP